MKPLEIARTIEVHKSTVSREISRNSDGRSHKYRDDLAQRKADKRARSKQHHVRLTEEIKGLITSYLCEVEAERGWLGRSRARSAGEVVGKECWGGREQGVPGRS